MKKLLSLGLLFCSSILYAAGNSKNVSQITFGDGTVQTTAASGSGGGSTIYNATSTAGFPFGFSASTGVFSSSVTINDPGRLLLPDGSSLTPSLARSAAKTTGINLSGTGIASLIAGTQILLIGSNASSFTNNLTLNYSPLDLTTNSEGVNYSATPNSNNNYYYRHVFTFQHTGGGSIDQFSTGMRDKVGEDPYWYIGPSDQVSATFGTDFIHVDVSSFSAQSGFIGINKSTPIVNLDVNGIIAVSTITAQAGFTGITISTPLYVVTGSTQSSTINNGLIVTGRVITSTATPIISACGSTPNGAVVGNDIDGKITIGGGAVTSCTMTFGGPPWANAPDCTILSNTAITAPTGATTTTVFTLGAGATFNGDIIMYHCASWQ